MARFLVYPALVALALWQALVWAKYAGALPPWATWTMVHGAPAAAYLAWAFVVSIVYAIKRWRIRYSLRSLVFFMMLGTCLWALYFDWGPWRLEKKHGRDTRVVLDAAFSPDAKRFITRSNDCAAWVWDSDMCEVLAVLKGHTDSVQSASFSPDGKTIITASRDGTARVWDSDTGKALAELKGHTSGVNSASFSSDGKRIVTASDDRTCRVWDSSTGGFLVELKGHRYGVFLATFSTVMFRTF